ncbi:hypothetical protein GCM10011609_76150 [Lentzea pudingi]|uniref:Uncharacterized protein n=1 Tax=Lentzea pudingi TaxID=1789439 RepID=A0ABQ2ISI2_9PSEU|nr:DUF2716 domain-containing protein [Lentzea pudingi]GGN23375.1 hypothetical protein GCM10011609_76150 [Lentzea pudingi]
MIQDYDERRLSRTPCGATREQDGALTRLHHGTHVTIEHTGAITGDLRALVERQKSIAAQRSEPVEWRIHRHLAAPGLAEHLVEAGFTEDGPTHVMIAERDRALASEELPENVSAVLGEEALDEARSVTPAAHRVWEDEAGAVTWYALRHDQQLTGVLWWHGVTSDKFIEFGMTGAHREFGPLPQRVAPAWPSYQRYLLVTATGDVRDLVAGQGFGELTSIRTFHWAPAGEPRAARAIQPIGAAAYRDLLARFQRKFEAEPDDSITWGSAFSARTAVTEVVRRGLTACTKPGELIFWADPYHPGIAADLRRVGGPGQPEWDEPVVGDGDHAVNAPFDLRFGSFGQHDENSLCVWGADLLAEVSGELDALLPRLRTGGEKI